MQSLMLDPFYIKTFQKTYKYTFSPEELEEARANGGEVTISIDGRTWYITIPTFIFPRDLITDSFSEVELTPWGQVVHV